MKRFHVHVAVPDLKQGIRFYSTMFGAEPAVVKVDYAKWMLEDPRVNFAISQRGGAAGINHLGFQVDEDAELQELHARLQAADAGVTEEKDVACCYARSDKYWVKDPAGVPWESFRSLGTVPYYRADEKEAGSTCCAPAGQPEAAGCCAPAQPAEPKAACCS